MLEINTTFYFIILLTLVLYIITFIKQRKTLIEARKFTNILHSPNTNAGKTIPLIQSQHTHWIYNVMTIAWIILLSYTIIVFFLKGLWILLVIYPLFILMGISILLRLLKIVK